LEKDPGKKINELFNSKNREVSIEEIVKVLEWRLQGERAAWAYAIKKFWPFIGREISKNELKIYVHKIVLGSHSRAIVKLFL
jgi:hypothetical protein